MDDKTIVDLFLARDERAVTETKNKYDKYLTKIAYNILASDEDSEESVSDTYLAAWNSIPPHTPSDLSTYLAKLTRRISIDIFRKRFRSKRYGSEYTASLSELSEAISDGTSPETILDGKILAEAINAFLRTVSRDTRLVFIGRYFYCDSVRDISSYSQMSESKVKSLLFRARVKLREFLQKEGFEI